jgi:hypothetical protein
MLKYDCRQATSHLQEKSMNKPEMIAALRKIIGSEGVDIIADKKRLSAYLSDFLPGYRYKNERRALLTAADADDWKILLTVHSKGQSEHERAMKILLRQLQEDFNWTKESSILILECFTAAMGWKDVDVGSIAANNDHESGLEEEARRQQQQQQPGKSKIAKELITAIVPTCVVGFIVLFAIFAVHNYMQQEIEVQVLSRFISVMDFNYNGYEDARKAAEQGDADAQCNLGHCYDNGKGVTQNYTEAVKWFRKAAEQGDADAQYKLGEYYYNDQSVTQDRVEAVKWYRRAAEQGHARAQNNLGYCYEHGQVVTQDRAEAVKWYREAAEQGNAGAQWNLGFCYEKGKGVSKDFAEAVKWYRKAAEQGIASAQLKLAHCYCYGQGVAPDRDEAVKWYRKAAEQGDAEAKKKLKRLGAL